MAEDKVIYIVISEECYGGALLGTGEVVEAFVKLSDARKYAEEVGNKHNLEMVVVKRSIRDKQEDTH